MNKLLSSLPGLAALLVLGGCITNLAPSNTPPTGIGTVATTPNATGQEPVVIRDNKGGNVIATIQRRQELERWGGPVEVRGYCGSACTLFITMPTACLGPNATVGFHAPRIPNTKIIPTGVDEIMGSYYRNGVLREWNNNWKHSLKIQKISAKEYVALDPETRLCAD